MLINIDFNSKFAVFSLSFLQIFLVFIFYMMYHSLNKSNYDIHKDNPRNSIIIISFKLGQVGDRLVLNKYESIDKHI